MLNEAHNSRLWHELVGNFLILLPYGYDMRRTHSAMQIRLYLVGISILLAGLLGGVLVYATAADEKSEAVGYQIVGGDVYAISPDDSKAYRRDEELYGGKAAVLEDELNRWFASLWQGKRLAYTLASLSAAAALVCFLAAHYLFGRRSEDQDG